MFAIDKNKDYLLIGASSNDTCSKLENGVYNLEIRQSGPMSPPQILFSKNEDYKKGVVLNQGVFKEVREFFNEFFTESLTEARKALGMKNKLGVMFDGDPGTGKTFLAGQIAQEIADKHDAIGILVTKSADYSGLLDSIREDDPDRTIILIIDEFEKTFKRYDTDTLSFFSGVNERDNTIIITTVNDTSELPSFIKDRPSRFERIFNFTFNNDEVLKSIISNMIPSDYKEKLNIDDLVVKIHKHKNMSIDRIKHILRDVIAANIEKEKTGIVKEVIIQNDSINRTKIAGFSTDSTAMKYILSDTELSEELDILDNIYKN